MDWGKTIENLGKAVEQEVQHRVDREFFAELGRIDKDDMGTSVRALLRKHCRTKEQQAALGWFVTEALRFLLKKNRAEVEAEFDIGEDDPATFPCSIAPSDVETLAFFVDKSPPGEDAHLIGFAIHILRDDAMVSDEQHLSDR